MFVQIHPINIPICILQGVIIVAAVVLILKFKILVNLVKLII